MRKFELRGTLHWSSAVNQDKFAAGCLNMGFCWGPTEVKSFASKVMVSVVPLSRIQAVCFEVVDVCDWRC